MFIATANPIGTGGLVDQSEYFEHIKLFIISLSFTANLRFETVKLMSIKDHKMPKDAGQNDRAPRYRQAREGLISAAVEIVLNHCSEEDRERLKLMSSSAPQDSEVFIPEFNNEITQYADLIAQQAIATISMQISKQYNISIPKPDACV